MSDGSSLAERLAARVALPRTHAEEILTRFAEVDDRLATLGFPRTSPWWRETIDRWYRSGRRQLVDRVGRRGGKSSTLSRLGVVEALYGHHRVQPGDVGTVAVISTDRPEASGRLLTIEAILDALGVAHRPCKAPKVGIALVGRPIEFRVFAATISGVSGFTSIFVIADEVAKWKDADTGVNPATTVLASVRPTMVTMANARMVLSSSPMGMLDAHYDAFEAGDTDMQVTAWAPTWVANPTLTEADTRALEPDESTHAREYGAIPQREAESGLLTDHLVTRMARGSVDDPRREGAYYVATMDPATRGNAFTLSIATRDADGVRRVVAVREKRGSPMAPLSPKETLREWKPLLESYGLRAIYTDQWSLDAMQDSARDLGLTLIGEPWSTRSKAEAYEELLKLAQDDTAVVPDVGHVRADLLGVRKVLTRNGVSYVLATTPDGRHSDFAPSIAMAFVKAIHRTHEKAPSLDDAARAAKDKREFLTRMSRERRQILPVTHRRRGA